MNANPPMWAVGPRVLIACDVLLVAKEFRQRGSAFTLASLPLAVAGVLGESPHPSSSCRGQAGR